MDIYELINESYVVRKNKSLHLYENEKKEKLDTNTDKKLFDLIKNISSLVPEVAENSIKFHPRFCHEKENAFAIEDLTEEDYVNLATIDLEKLPLTLKARIAEILWTQKKNYHAACTAAKAYLDMFNMSFSDEEWYDTLYLIKRAIFIAAQIRIQELKRKCCQIVYEHVIRINGNDKKFLSLYLIEILLEQKYGDMDVLLNIIEKIICCNNNNVYIVERAYELKKDLFAIKKDKISIKRTNIDLAVYLEMYAEKGINENIQGIFRAEKFLKKAIMIYRDNGDPKEGERIHKRLVEIQKEIPKLMIPICNNKKIDMSRINANVVLNMEGLSFAECVIRLTQMIAFHKKDDMKNQLINEYKTRSLDNLFGENTINSSGQIILTLPPLQWEDIEKDSPLLDKHIFKRMLLIQNAVGNIELKYAFFLIRKLHDFQLEDLDFLVKDNPI